MRAIRKMQRVVIALALVSSIRYKRREPEGLSVK